MSGRRPADAHQMLRVPAEQLAQACRKQYKQVEKELDSAMGEIHQVLKDAHAAPSSMDGLVERLQGLKRKVEDGQVQEDELLQRCRMRLDYLQQTNQRDANPENSEAAAQTERLQRLVADYLLREGYDSSARCLAEAAGLEHYLDFELVLASRHVMVALQARHSSAPVHPWCPVPASASVRSSIDHTRAGAGLRASLGVVHRESRQAEEGGVDPRAAAAPPAVCRAGAPHAAIQRAPLAPLCRPLAPCAASRPLAPPRAL